MKKVFSSTGSALLLEPPSFLLDGSSPSQMPSESASKSKRTRRKRTTSVSAGKERTVESVESVSGIDNSIDMPEDLVGYPVEQFETPEDIANAACLETTPSDFGPLTISILPNEMQKNQSKSKQKRVLKSESSATAQSKNTKQNKRNTTMKRNKTLNLENEIKGLISSSDFPEETAIFAAKYSAFSQLYRCFNDWRGTGCGEAADLEFLRGFLPLVEVQTDKLNFFGKAVAGYRANIVARFDADVAAEIEELRQLHSVMSVQMHGIDFAYNELAWLVSEDCAIIYDAINEHSRNKTVNDSPKAA